MKRLRSLIALIVLTFLLVVNCSKDDEKLASISILNKPEHGRF